MLSIASTFWCHHQVKRINAWWASFPAHPVAMASGLQVPLDPLHSSRFTSPTAARRLSQSRAFVRQGHFSFWDLSFTSWDLEDRWGQQISAAAMSEIASFGPVGGRTAAEKLQQVDVQSSLRRATSAGGRWMLMLRFH